ncbi:MAG: 4Fe-4S binding protein [Firmicutes bacterium]|nr:4Fe-4S binding protein [Bacillota bacterium]
MLAVVMAVVLSLPVVLEVARRNSPGRGEPPESVNVELSAKRFAYSPGVIEVRRGQLVIMDITSADVTHGLYLDGYDISAVVKPGDTTRLEFVADRPGRFMFRCGVTCGPFHPYMVGWLRVSPNLPFTLAHGMMVLFAVGTLVWAWRIKGFSGFVPTRWRYELSRLKPVKAILRNRWFVIAGILVNMGIFVIILLSAAVGSPMGNANFGVMFVWILWWSALMLVMLPFLSRIWCMVCPLPVVGEWIARGAVVDKAAGRRRTPGRRWPRLLRNMWPVNFVFLGTAVFSGIITTRPWATGIMLGVIILVSIGIHLFFERRTFCRYLCPVGGFLGLYSNFSSLEVRCQDPEVCRGHKSKDCFAGNERGYGCPWLEAPFGMERNTYCGLCLECFKTCTLDNMSLNLRPFGTDLLVDKKRGPDESWKAFIMLGAAGVYALTMMGPWGLVRDWANIKTWPQWALFAAGFAALTMLVLPAVHGVVAALSAWATRGTQGEDVSGKAPESALQQGSGKQRRLLPKLFVSQSYPLVPLGLAAWVAFSFAIILPNGSYLARVISDPFNWGWNLFGTAGVPWKPMFTAWLPYLQGMTMALGLLFSLDTAWKLSKQDAGDRGTALALGGFAAQAAYLYLLAAGLTWLFIG